MTCAWCGQSSKTKLCNACFDTAMDVPKLTPEELDELPFGVIEVDADGIILAFNRSEANASGLAAKQVIGKNFFTEVAPCTRTKRFFGRFKTFLEGHKLFEQFNYTYKFHHVSTDVHILFTHVDERHALILSKRTSVAK